MAIFLSWLPSSCHWRNLLLIYGSFSSELLLLLIAVLLWSVLILAFAILIIIINFFRNISVFSLISGKNDLLNFFHCFSSVFLMYVKQFLHKGYTCCFLVFSSLDFLFVIDTFNMCFLSVTKCFCSLHICYFFHNNILNVRKSFF